MPKFKVLLLDDDEDNLTVLEAALESSFEVKTAGSCASAKQALGEWPADALVADMRLGDGTALDLLRDLGARRPRVAVVVTGMGRPEDREASRAAGFQAHLVKPIALGELERLLNAELERPARAQGTGSP